MKPLRVVFDTNTFMPVKFDLLEHSAFKAQCKKGRITPIYGHVFLEETFRAYGSEHKRQDLIDRWIPLIVATVDRFCDDLIGIWNKELVQGKGDKANIFMSRRSQDILVSRLPYIPLDGSWRAWHESRSVRDIENAKRDAQREISKGIRQEIADWRKAIRYHPKNRDAACFETYLEKEIDSAGRQFLKILVECKNPDSVTDRWVRAKTQYPYFTNFIINMLYITHHAMTKHNDGIDLNAQADLDLMTHLLNADVLVSNEAGFMSQAFDDLWRPRGKTLFTSEQFADFVQKL